MFKLSMEFSEDYPNKAPVVKFRTTMFHPNSERGGGRAPFRAGSEGARERQHMSQRAGQPAFLRRAAQHVAVGCVGAADAARMSAHCPGRHNSCLHRLPPPWLPLQSMRMAASA